jgi:hypothetical protein
MRTVRRAHRNASPRGFAIERVTAIDVAIEQVVDARSASVFLSTSITG